MLRSVSSEVRADPTLALPLTEQDLEVLVGDGLLLVGHRLGSVDQGPEGGLVVGHVFVAHVDEARLVRG